MRRALHPHPNLEVLKKQAKEILKAHKLADGSRESGVRTAYSCQTLRSLHRFAGRPDSEILEADIKLTDVQHALASQYGFESWQKLKQHVASGEPTIPLMTGGGRRLVRWSSRKMNTTGPPAGLEGD